MRRLPLPESMLLDLRAANLNDFVNSFRHLDYTGELESLRSRQCPTTCEWFFDNEHFTWWAPRPESAALWFTGALGLGKSTLLAHVVHELLERHAKTPANARTGTVYSFCKEQRNHTASMVLSNAIHQLLIQFPDAHSQLYDYDNLTHTWRGVYSRVEGKTRSAYVLLDLLRRVVRFAQLERLYFVIDAIDECDHDAQETLLRQLFYEMEGKVCIKVLISSRPNSPVEHDFRHWTVTKPSNFRQFGAEDYDDAIRRDIEYFVERRFERLSNSHDVTSGQRKDFIAKWSTEGSSLFLPVTLLLQQFEHDKTGDIDGLLSDIPKDLRAQYEQLMSQTNEKSKALQQHVFTFLTYTFAPLSVRDIAFLHKYASCGSRKGGSTAFTDREKELFLKDILRLGPLLKLSRDGFVEFVHVSIKEYLRSERACQEGFVLSEQHAHRMLSTVSLHALADNRSRQFEFSFASMERAKQLKAIVLDQPMLVYGVRTWSKHLKAVTDHLETDQFNDKELEAAMHAFLEAWVGPYPSFRAFVLAQAYKEGFARRESNPAAEVIGAGRHFFELMCEFGLTFFVRRYIHDLENRNRLGELRNYVQVALLLAIRNGHVALVELLIEKFELTSLNENIYHDVIAEAAWSQNEALLRAIMSLRVPRLNELTEAVFAAYTTGKLNTLRELVRDPFIFKECDRLGRTALHLIFLKYFNSIGAAKNVVNPRTLLAVAIFLIDNGVKVNAKDKFGFTALHYACWCSDICNREIIAGLVHWGADPFARTNGGLTAFHFAAAFADNRESVRFMLDITHNELIRTQSNACNTPLHWAASLRRRKVEESVYVLKLLVLRGGDPYTLNKFGLSPNDYGHWDVMLRTYRFVDRSDNDQIPFRLLHDSEQEIQVDKEDMNDVEPIYDERRKNLETDDSLLAEVRLIQPLERRRQTIEFRLVPRFEELPDDEPAGNTAYRTDNGSSESLRDTTQQSSSTDVAAFGELVSYKRVRG